MTGAADGSTLYLLRHAQSAPSRDLAESDWPLSARGRSQSLALVSRLRALSIDHCLSSPYRRAIETITPTAEALGQRVAIEPDLRERALTSGFVDDWERLTATAWADLSLSHPGGESGRACQTRVARCLERLAATNRGRRLLVCSHGQAIGLFLHTLDPTFGYEAWQNMRMPDLFRLDWLDGRWTYDRTFTFPEEAHR